MYLSIIIIEDDIKVCERIGKFVYEELLGEVEVSVEKYEDAESFLLSVEKKKAYECPDIVISDIDLPGMNGIELGARLKKTMQKFVWYF